MIKEAKKQKFYLQNKRGFSFVESIIGIAIVGGVFVTFLALIPGIIKTESDVQKKIIANNLAIEGVEMLLNLRENNIKNGCFARESDSPLCYFPAGASPQLHMDPYFRYQAFENKNIHQMPPYFNRYFVIWYADDQYEGGHVDYLFVIIKYKGVTIGSKHITLRNWGQKKL